MLTPPPEPPVTAHLLLVGGSRGRAIAFAEKQHFGPDEWAWIPAPGPLRVFALHAEGTSAAGYVCPRRPSEALDEHWEEVTVALHGLGVEAASVVGSIAWGTDTDYSDINLLVTFVPPRPEGLDWVTRVMQVEEVVFEITGFPCDVAEDGNEFSARLPLFGSP